MEKKTALILDTAKGKPHVLFLKTDCRSAEVNYQLERQHAVHITIAMFCHLLL